MISDTWYLILDIWYLIFSIWLFETWFDIYLKLNIWNFISGISYLITYTYYLILILYLISETWYMRLVIWYVIKDAWYFILDILESIFETWYLIDDILYMEPYAWYLIFDICYLKVRMSFMLNIWYLKVKMSFGPKAVISSLSKLNIESKNFFYKRCSVWYAIWECQIKSES